MEGTLAAWLSALWLGLLTSVSPCPLATNIVAVSYVSKGIGSPRRVLLAGLLYTAGRSLAYLILGALIVFSLLSVPAISEVVQKYTNKVLGPVLILAGMALLGLLRIPIPSFSVGEKVQRGAAGSGLGGAVLLGFVLALSFCPVSAALFFGSLVPLALKQQSGIGLPLIYGVGTGLPVLAFALALALGVRSVTGTLERVARIERWARMATGLVFIGVGVYYCLLHIFRIWS
jgi:cytochrome c biogenesis protein CcdA